jgi:hypothetical protein
MRGYEAFRKTHNVRTAATSFKNEGDRLVDRAFRSGMPGVNRRKTDGLRLLTHGIPPSFDLTRLVPSKQPSCSDFTSSAKTPAPHGAVRTHCFGDRTISPSCAGFSVGAL